MTVDSTMTDALKLSNKLITEGIPFSVVKKENGIFVITINSVVDENQFRQWLIDTVS